MRKITQLIAGLIFYLLLFVKPVSAESSVNIYFFWGDGCPHCAKEEPFLQKLEDKYPQVKVQEFEVWYKPENQKLMQEASKVLNAKVSGVPFTVIGDKYISGFQDEETTGKAIEKTVVDCIENTCDDPLAAVVKNQTDTQSQNAQSSSSNLNIPDVMNFPIIGKVKTREVSLPVITILIAGLDGFNPCAMWTLIFLISLLLGMHDKKKMWILGSAFIVASAGVYFLFMAAWLNLIIFIGFIYWIRIAIGLIAIGGGVYNLREYMTNKDASCKVTGGEKRKKVFDSLRKLTHEKNFLLALGGIIILAAAVNLVELICSAGLPVVFTQILALNNLPTWQYYMYMLLYIFIFMLDDLFVFIISMKTLEVSGVTTKYSHTTHLIGGVLMLIIGAILILKPEILMFG